jgi:L-threonylcarbamoyladenylate synthase
VVTSTENVLDPPGALDEAVAALRAGCVVAVATESWFALAADARSPSAVELLFRIKGRDFKHAVALMAPDVAHWRSCVKTVPPLAQVFAEAFWPGPLTLVLEAVEHLDQRLVHAGTVGVRVPGPCAAADLVQRFGSALTASSANLAGEPPCRSSDEVRNVFGAWLERGVLRIVDGQAPGGAPSTLVHVGVDAFAVVRAGAIGAPELDACARAAGLTTHSRTHTA